MKRPPGVTPPPPGARPTTPQSAPSRAAAENTPEQLQPRAKPARPGSEAPWWTRRKSEATSADDQQPTDVIAQKSASPQLPVVQLTEPLPFVRSETPRIQLPETLQQPSTRPVGSSTGPSLKEAERRRKRYEKAEARRFTKRSRERRRNLLIGAGVVAILVVLAVLTAYSPLLTLRTITVDGASRVDATAVKASLADQIGKPLSLVDFGRIQTELGAYPLIQSYVTETRPPNTLVVKIVERQPVASIATKSGFDLVDPAGVVIQETPDAPAGYPAIDTNNTKVGTAGFAAIGAMLLALPADFRSQISLVGAATPDSIAMLLTTGEHVVWGSADQSPLKARILKALIAQPDLDTSSVDISSPDAPVTGG
jgi:cell division protein FtsQ